MASVLPSDLVIRVLNPIIKTGDYPVNQAAIKMLTKVADHSDNTEVILMHLPEIMPGLLKVWKVISKVSLSSHYKLTYCSLTTTSSPV